MENITGDIYGVSIKLSIVAIAFIFAGYMLYRSIRNKSAREISKFEIVGNRVAAILLIISSFYMIGVLISRLLKGESLTDIVYIFITVVLIFYVIKRSKYK